MPYNALRRDIVEVLHTSDGEPFIFGGPEGLSKIQSLLERSLTALGGPVRHVRPDSVANLPNTHPVNPEEPYCTTCQVKTIEPEQCDYCTGPYVEACSL